MDQHTGGDAVVDALEAAGVQVVFGIPSVHNLPIYDAIRRRGTIRAITVRHEQAAAGAADGYARSTGRLGVFMTSTGPGAANAMGGQLEAFLSGSPVLHITGQIETRYLDEGRGFLHEVPDQPEMLESCSKAVLRAEAADDIARSVAVAVKEALSAPRGPVAVELPIDLQYSVAAVYDREALAELASARPPAAPRQDELERAAAIVAASRRPLVWAGGGVVSSGAETEVADLVKRIGAGLVTSPNGRGVLDEHDPHCIGNLSWDPDVRGLFAGADVLIGIGTRYQGPNTENWKMVLPGTIVQIDVTPERPARNYPATAAVAGDAKLAVQALGDLLEAAGAKGSEEGWLERIGEARSAARSRLRHVIGSQEGLLDEFAGAIGKDTVVVKDATIPAYTWGNRLLPVRRSRTAIMPNGFAIGLGLPHAIGAGAAAAAAAAAAVKGGAPATPAVLMAGDGGFMLAASELATLAREQLPVVVVVFSDGGYGILRNIQDTQYGELDGRIGVELGQPDFVRLAEALGVKGERVGSSGDFGRAFTAALEAGKPHLIEVDLGAIGPMNRPYTGTSRPPAGTTRVS